MNQAGRITCLALVVGIAAGCVVTLSGAGILIQSALSWPTRPYDEQGRPRMSGWFISSPYGWRPHPFRQGEIEFHDGIDIASSTGACPFGERCEVVSMVDGVVSYIGWDDQDDPLGSGGGQTVSVVNGEGEFETVFAHLEPYRLYVRLEGRIVDDYGRYDAWAEYAPIGEGELVPGPESVRVSVTCSGDAPQFVLVESGASMMFVYDRPARCRTSVAWSRRGGGWQGWIPDSPTSVAWETPIVGSRDRMLAHDVGILFRATLIPPPPPPTATPTRAPSPISAMRAATPVAIHTPMQPLRPWTVPTTAMGEHCRPAEHPCVWEWSPRRGNLLLQTNSDQPSMSEGGSLAWQWNRTQHDASHSVDSSPVMHAAFQQSQTRVMAHVSIDGDVAVAAGGRVGVYFVVSSTDFPLAIAIDTHPSLIVRDVTILHGACTGSGTTRVCSRYGDSSTVIGTMVIDVDEQAAFGSRLTLLVAARHEASGVAASAQADIVVRDVRVTPQPWPPPPPTAAIPATAYPPPGAATPRPTPAPPEHHPGQTEGCMMQPLVPVPQSLLPNGRPATLAQSAAQSLEAVRRETMITVGVDPFAQLADALRPPEFRSSKPGVARYSWHMTGSAIDVDLGFPWRRVREGAYWRLYVSGVDVTAILERHGWSRIPDRPDSQEWWHYERREGRSWRTAMRQVWPLERLRAAFPEIPWETIGCAGDQRPLEPTPMTSADRCHPEMPSFHGPVSSAPGCGPPVRLGMIVRQLTDRIGFIGRTGASTGWHLHLSVRSSGARGMVTTYVCSDAWLRGRRPPSDAVCWTDTINPLEALPLALEEPRMADGQPLQLPPPGERDHYMLGNQILSGMYWSPNPIDGPYGGGTWADLLRDWIRHERSSPP